jgi:signal transduction histidine kinase
VLISTAWVLSDAVMLDRILRNLLDNAVKYTDGGRIAVQVDERERSSRHGARQRRRHRCGRPRPHLRGVLPGAQSGARPARGMGLGLAIVKRLCDLLGHRIDVESAPGRQRVHA